MPNPEIRKGMPSVKLTREEFSRRYRSRYADPAFKALDREIEAIIAAAWDAYSHSRKAPNTRKAGRDFPIPTTRSPSTGSPHVTRSWRRSAVMTTPGRRRAY